jgi:hypothetical protein
LKLATVKPFNRNVRAFVVGKADAHFRASALEDYEIANVKNMGCGFALAEGLQHHVMDCIGH